MVSNLRVICHLKIPKRPFSISGVKSKNNLRGYVAFLGNTIQKKKCNFMIRNY